MEAPQITMIVLFAIELLLNANSHGKQKEGHNNFWITLLSHIVILAILFWGGFFK
jgi:hypothetical protein